MDHCKRNYVHPQHLITTFSKIFADQYVLLSNPKITSTSCSVKPLSALMCGMFCCTSHFLNRSHSVLTAWLDIIPAHSWWNVAKQLKLITNLFMCICMCFLLFCFFILRWKTMHFFGGGCFKLRFIPCLIWVSNLHRMLIFFLCIKCGDSRWSQKAISDRMTIGFIVLIITFRLVTSWRSTDPA